MFRKIKESAPIKLNNSGKMPFASRFQKAGLYASVLALSLGAFGSHSLTSELLVGGALAADAVPYTPVIKNVSCDHPSKEMVFTQNLLEDFKKTMPTIPEVGSDELAYQEVDGLLDDLYGYRGEHGKMINKPMLDLLKKWVRGKTTIEENKRLNFGLLQSDLINTKATSFETLIPPTVEEWASLWGAWGTPQFPEEIDKLNKKYGSYASPEQNSRALAELRAIESTACPSGSGDGKIAPVMEATPSTPISCDPLKDEERKDLDSLMKKCETILNSNPPYNEPFDAINLSFAKKMEPYFARYKANTATPEDLFFIRLAIAQNNALRMNKNLDFPANIYGKINKEQLTSFHEASYKDIGTERYADTLEALLKDPTYKLKVADYKPFIDKLKAIQVTPCPVAEGDVCTPKDDKGQVKMDANGNPLTGHWKKKAAPEGDIK